MRSTATRNTGVSGVRLKDTQNGSTRDFKTDGVFIAIGHRPNSALFKGQLEMDEIGYLKLQPGSTYTNIAGVFAAGDVADPGVSPGRDRGRHRMHGRDRRRAMARGKSPRVNATPPISRVSAYANRVRGPANRRAWRLP